MIEIKNLLKKYERKTVLEIPHFIFESGMRYALVGSNGSGKTTLLRILAGIMKPDGGEIIKDYSKPAYMPQKCFGFSLSVTANLLMAKNDRERAEYLTAQFGLERYREKSAAKLSGGETQRMALARTLIVDFDLLLLDEPTAAMDFKSSKTAEEVIAKELKKAGASLIFATHTITQAKAMADRVVIMSGGKIAEEVASGDFPFRVKSHEAFEFLDTYVGFTG